MNDLIQILVNKASKFGAQGYEVVGWIPPASATQNPEGLLVLKSHYNESISGSDTPWQYK